MYHVESYINHLGSDAGSWTYDALVDSTVVDCRMKARPSIT